MDVADGKASPDYAFSSIWLPTNLWHTPAEKREKGGREVVEF